MREWTERLDLASMRARLATSRGKEYWRTLEELAETDTFKEFLDQNFSQQAPLGPGPVDRRRFLQLMGASLALAGLGACTRQPAEEIVPYVRQPEEISLGQPLRFATALTLSGIASGVLVESHEGRPTKVEGNPDHPASLGATDVYAQASVLALYDPDRAQTVSYIGDIQSWSAFLGAIRSQLERCRALKGAGLRILTGAVSSPTLAFQIQNLLHEIPQAKWYQFEPARGEGAHAGTLQAFGAPANAVYHFEKAEVVLSLDSDFLSSGAGWQRYARDFMKKRGPDTGGGEMNRLYVVESNPTNTGAKADHRLSLSPSAIEKFTRALAIELGVCPNEVQEVGGLPSRWFSVTAQDLRRHNGASLIVPGEYQPAVVHALAHAMNVTLGNVGRTVVYTDPVEFNPVSSVSSLRELLQEMDSGQVEILLILGVNPAYSTPTDLNFVKSMSKVRLRVHLGLYYDETSELCHWHIPQAHDLESWSDARAYDGTISIIQPLIAPLYHGKTPHEFLAALTDKPERSSYEIVRDYWKTQRQTLWQSRKPAERSSGEMSEGRSANLTGHGESSRARRRTANSLHSMSADLEFELFWRKALHDGLIEGTSLPAKAVALKDGWSTQISSRNSPKSRRDTEAGPSLTLEILFRPDPTVYDGRFANNGWLQELPKPLTKLTWDNAALLSPATAERFGISQQIANRGGEHGQVLADRIELELAGRKLSAPAWIVPGHADGCITVHLGYGRDRAGSVGTGRGFNAYAICQSDHPWSDLGVTIRKTGGTYPLACTQYHHNMEGRDLLRSGSLDEYRMNPGFAQDEYSKAHRTPSLYPDYSYAGYAWGMVIDLNCCVGCNACVVACQAENNIPVVGKEEVLHGREMHWIRIDRYYRGNPDDPETDFQPVLCQHCENAPCELVCPVQATTHSAEGLNNMVYNRCIGTRYCSNNCPYKVRRFNFLQFADWDTPSLKLLRNPDVTVRSRGVMEKCTYCVQRITQAKISAEKEDRQVRDGEIVTACQAVCPANAIVFGNINDPTSRVSNMKASPRNYGLLSELNTRPRTTYLAAVRNPNPDLKKA